MVRIEKSSLEDCSGRRGLFWVYSPFSMVSVGDTEGRASECLTISGVSWHIILTDYLNAKGKPSHKNSFCLHVRHTDGISHLFSREIWQHGLPPCRYFAKIVSLYPVFFFFCHVNQYKRTFGNLREISEKFQGNNSWLIDLFRHIYAIKVKHQECRAHYGTPDVLLLNRHIRLLNIHSAQTYIQHPKHFVYISFRRKPIFFAVF